MRINVKAYPKSHTNLIYEKDGTYIVRTTAPAAGNLANKAIIKMISDKFSIGISNIKIISGQNFREKILELKETKSDQ
ncbi:hypothetical protein AUK11_04045 [bacterium CG2_30_37_16]|nr:MAG: hypothetical protein AUK11_04045 [bacterium CG2_30_37_16]PIP30545.1 MAG: hypothetical protein COX25_04185 [bacterium (Candidatus Howlettbacteria) CG23_combo_of_CG06-09_8_20_14_all_37_9]PIX98949.1 MAG: hypothetical protein COZ22_03815 [bacterium (Candidatus Howlettbacteria) CG_4_10_14_3_um_filter_37_10]PJB07217.1 MAG: hypothetical protein CO123_00480 [bacterium (Candidatus Howlettbacteria) CG_4_9_14_3_um_filter_37_10]